LSSFRQQITPTITASAPWDLTSLLDFAISEKAGIDIVKVGEMVIDELRGLRLFREGYEASPENAVNTAEIVQAGELGDLRLVERAGVIGPKLHEAT